MIDDLISSVPADPRSDSDAAIRKADDFYKDLYSAHASFFRLSSHIEMILSYMQQQEDGPGATDKNCGGSFNQPASHKKKKISPASDPVVIV